MKGLPPSAFQELQTLIVSLNEVENPTDEQKAAFDAAKAKAFREATPEDWIKLSMATTTPDGQPPKKWKIDDFLEVVALAQELGCWSAGSHEYNVQFQVTREPSPAQASRIKELGAKYEQKTVIIEAWVARPERFVSDASSQS